ncbi:MAG: outer membrane beta-barrel protein [Caldithrix sp.]|nr:outer membrane beta-barrel protein [Caldithrix sp.]
MKITVLLVLIFSHFCFSQMNSDYRIGGKIGMNISHIVRDESSRSDFNDPYMKIGITFGFVVDKTINENTSIQGELVYNQVGSRWGNSMFENPGHDHAVYNLEYVTIPIYFKLNSKIGDLFTDFDFLLGASYSYNISAKQEVTIESYDEIDYGPKNIRDELNHNELGVLAGIKLPFYKDRIYFSLQYYWALTRLYHSPTIAYPDELQNKSEFKNRSFTISFDVFIN